MYQKIYKNTKDSRGHFKKFEGYAISLWLVLVPLPQKPKKRLDT